MPYIATTATKKIARMRKRIRAVPGGTSAGKTVAWMQVLIDLAQTDMTPTLTSVVSESIPHLKAGAIRDFKAIMSEHGYWKDDNWNATDRIYTLETGSMIEFFSADNGDKCRGPRRDRLFINEANHVSYEAYQQLEVRTNEFIALDWNPSDEFWYYTDVRGNPNVEEVTLTYLDNEGLPDTIRQSIEARKNNRRWWTVYGLGQLGDFDEKIYSGWETIDEIPHEARLERRGLDFGYTNDPTAIVDIHRYNGAWILDEQAYQTGMVNRVIADLLKSLPSVLTYADSAEPKSIEEIRQCGVMMFPASKGPGSINQGIQYLQGQKVFVTRRSVNLLKEYRSYMWKVDRDGKVLNVPDEGNDHCLDAVRYGFTGIFDAPSDIDMARERAFLRSYNED